MSDETRPQSSPRTIRIPDELWAWFAAEGIREDRSAAYVANQALVFYREHIQRTRKRTERRQPGASGRRSG